MDKIKPEIKPEIEDFEKYYYDKHYCSYLDCTSDYNEDYGDYQEEINILKEKSCSTYKMMFLNKKYLSINSKINHTLLEAKNDFVKELDEFDSNYVKYLEEILKTKQDELKTFRKIAELTDKINEIDKEIFSCTESKKNFY